MARIRTIAGALACVIGTALAGGALPAAGAASAAAAAQDEVKAVSCATAHFCVAVGSGATVAPLVEAWNGHEWAVQQAPVPAAAVSSVLYGVSCVSATRCEAVGEYRNGALGPGGHFPLAERWNGRRWAIQRIPGTGRLAGVSCTSRRACMAVGATALENDSDKMMAARWNGRRWARHVFPVINGDDDLNGVSCTSARRCIAAGDSFQGDHAGYAIAERWNGRRWWRQRVPGPAPLHFWGFSGVSCSSRAACTAVGGRGVIDADYGLPLAMRWNGQRWARQHVPGGSTANLTVMLLSAVSCPSASMCMAAGYRTDDTGTYTPVTGLWDGTAWSLTANPVSGGALEGVSCSSPAACTAVGETPRQGSGQPFAERWDGTAWTVQPMPAA